MRKRREREEKEMNRRFERGATVEENERRKRSERDEKDIRKRWERKGT